MSLYRKLQKRIYEILEVADHGDKVSKLVDFFISGTIIINVIHLILESDKAIYGANKFIFEKSEDIFVWIFSIEYLLRIWSVGHSEKYDFSIKDRLKYMKSPMAVIDLLAILPAWLPFIGLDFRFLRAFRLLRLIKLTRYSKSMQTFEKVLKETKDQLIALTIACFFIMVLSSCFVYYAEHEAQPEVFSSIPVSMWWSIVTMTTVGYGDMAPITLAGRMLAIPIFVGGIGLFAAFTGVIGSAFMEEHQKNKKGNNAD
jgi:voltage-gated potassium channel